MELPEGGVEQFWMAPDGWPIRRIDLAPRHHARGSLLFMPGRGDFYEKYLESLEEWRDAGWHLTSLDWRGQAGSGRLGMDDSTGHVDDFGVWIEDLAAFWREWRGERPGPVALIGHSMGGHLALRALAQGRVDPDALVLSAPMLGFAAGGAPFWSQKALGWAMLKLGDARRPAWSGGEKPASSLHARKGLLTHDARRYQQEMDWRAARPELAMGPASWGWMAAGLRSMETFMAPGVLERVETPVLILSTAADGLVCHRANLKAAQRLPHGEIMSFGPEAAHEILREVDAVRAPAMARIEAFLREHVALPIRSDLTRALRAAWVGG